MKKADGTIVNYAYDVLGNRISKQVGNVQTWYVRDATGNVVSIYTKGNPALNGGALTQTEVDLYGSSRLGINTLSTNVEIKDSTITGLTGLGAGININFIRGKKFFELSNHLGNVLATVSDKKLGVSVNGSVIDYYIADIVSAQEYYPFGMQMPGRGFNSEKYRYGFNGKENDNEVKGAGNQIDYGMRVYDPRIGKFLSVDPLTKKYPYLTPYQFASNTPVQAIDLDGKEKLEAFFLLDDKNNGKVLNQNATAVQIIYDFKERTISAMYGTVGGTAIRFEYGMDSKKLSPVQGKLSQDDIVQKYGQVGTAIPAKRLLDKANEAYKVIKAFGGIDAIESMFDEADSKQFKYLKDNKMEYLFVGSRDLLEKYLNTPGAQTQVLDDAGSTTVRIFENEPINVSGKTVKLGLVQLVLPKTENKSSTSKEINIPVGDFFKNVYDKLSRGIYDTEQWLKNGAPRQ
jgi:RHS repeat-associated protein